MVHPAREFKPAKNMINEILNKKLNQMKLSLQQRNLTLVDNDTGTSSARVS